jgi:hypothetical protein
MSDKTESNNKLTTVKTVYARAAMLLLAVNFCLTTYVVVNLNSSVQMQVDEANGVTSEELTTVSQPTTTTTPPSTTQEVSTEPSE